MKTLLKPILLFPLLLMSCYIFDYSGNSRIAIRLGTFPADVKKVHLAVFEGYQSNENLLLTTVLTSGSIAEVDVPAGDNRYFVIVGENYNGEAEYLGASGPYIVSNEYTTTVSVAMNYIGMVQNDIICYVDIDNNSTLIVWDFISKEHKLWMTSYDAFLSYSANFSEAQLIYQGPINSASVNRVVDPEEVFFLRGYFEYFNIYTPLFENFMNFF